GVGGGCRVDGLRYRPVVERSRPARGLERYRTGAAGQGPAIDPQNLSRYGQTPNFLGNRSTGGVRSNSADLRRYSLAGCRFGDRSRSREVGAETADFSQDRRTGSELSGHRLKYLGAFD